MTKCAVSVCNNTYSVAKNKEGVKISFHHFPRKDLELQTFWLHFCRRKGRFNPATSHICSEHFTADQFETSELQRKLLDCRVKLKPTAYPTIFIINAKQSGCFQHADKRKYTKKRDRKKLVYEIPSEDSPSTKRDLEALVPLRTSRFLPQQVPIISEVCWDKRSMVERYLKLLEDYDTLQKYYNKLLEKNTVQKEQIQKLENETLDTLNYLKQEKNKNETLQSIFEDVFSVKFKQI